MKCPPPPPRRLEVIDAELIGPTHIDHQGLVHVWTKILPFCVGVVTELRHVGIVPPTQDPFE